MQEEGKSVEEGDNRCRRQHGGLFMVVGDRGRIPSSQAEEVAFHNIYLWLGCIQWKILTLDQKTKKNIFYALKNCILGHWSFSYKVNFFYV